MKIKKVKKLLSLVLSFAFIIIGLSGMATKPAKAAGAAPGLKSGYSYYLRAKHSDRCLDLQGSEVSNGTHFQQYDQGYPSELFKITLQTDGYYTLETTLIGASGTMVMDGRSNCVAGAQVILYQYDSTCSEQRWEIRQNSNGTYCLSPKKNLSLNLAVENWSWGNNAKVKLEAKNDNMFNQQFYIEDQERAMNILGNEVYYLRNVNSGKYLDLQNNGTTNGTNFQQYSYVSSPCAERFKVIKRTDGYFVFVSDYATTPTTPAMVMDGRSNCVSGAQVILYKFVYEAGEQIWHVKKNDNGTFCISPKKNVYLNLAVEGGSSANNAKVKLASRNYDSPSQQWCLEPAIDGTTSGIKGYAWRYPFENSDFTHIISGYHVWRPEFGFHYAIDIKSKNSNTSIAGAPILSPMTGTVVYKNDNEYSSGYYIVIEFDSFFTGTGEKLRAGFMHMREPSDFKKGDKVRKNDVIGYVGKSGNAQDYHLDLSVFRNVIYPHHPDENPGLYTLNPQRFFPWTTFTGETSTDWP
ncbi:MAG: peptidoglycan DD-metalloendopeptidase family protein [Clostridiales bacterium]|nr:peptidoglycan DD-metalloendopeptidase family protein [Clostridiales bacterium]